MGISEEDLPGIGRRYEVMAARGQRVVLIVHSSGRRDLYVMERNKDDPTAVVELTDDQARRIGAILGGAFFKPVVVEEIERIVGEFVVDWVTLDDDAPAVGHSLSDLQVRRQTGMSVVAIVRRKQTITAPDPGEQLLAGDRLVVVGRRQDLSTFAELVLG
ncbi:MAG TPA: TrkA C-terminal domain-containing protein [Actinomycetota bacterium]|nr:TrkA C-terminal domain-containing protein [Actinomycetota bacterium]